MFMDIQYELSMVKNVTNFTHKHKHDKYKNYKNNL